MAASLSLKGNGLTFIDTADGSLKDLVSPVLDERLRSPFVHGRYVFYCSDYSGIDNIYCIDTVSQKRYQVTSRRYGAFSPAVSSDGKNIYFSDYTGNGYNAVSMPFEPAKWTPLDKVKRSSINYYDPIMKQEAGKRLDIEENVPKKQYPVENYSPFLNSINFYGWIPSFFAEWNMSTKSSKIDFTLLVQSLDVHQTTAVNVGYIFNFNEQTNTGLASLVYAGLFPVFSFAGSFGQRGALINYSENGEEKSDIMRWDEGTAFASIGIPLDFSRGVHGVYLNLATTFGYIHIFNKDHPEFSINNMNRDGELQYFRYSLAAAHLLQGHNLQVGPRWGQVINVNYSHTPFYGDYKGRLLSSELTLYFPGIFRTHNLSIGGV